MIANNDQDLAYARSVSENADNPDAAYALYLMLCYQIRLECADRGETFDSEKFYNRFVTYTYDHEMLTSEEAEYINAIVG